jgi:hypothetical protein
MKDRIIKSKTEKIFKYSNSYFECPLKYVGYGEVEIRHSGILNTRTHLYKGYEVTGIFKQYLNNKLFFIKQINSGINHGPQLQLWRIK